MLGGISVLPLASQLISIGYLMLLGIMWGFLWEVLEELSKDNQKNALLLFAFMLPISGVVWYISNGGLLRSYVIVAVMLGIIVFALISRRTIGATIALAIKRIWSAVFLLFTLVAFFLRLAIESLALVLYSLYGRLKSRRNVVPKYN